MTDKQFSVVFLFSDNVEEIKDIRTLLFVDGDEKKVEQFFESVSVIDQETVGVIFCVSSEVESLLEENVGSVAVFDTNNFYIGRAKKPMSLLESYHYEFGRFTDGFIRHESSVISPFELGDFDRNDSSLDLGEILPKGRKSKAPVNEGRPFYSGKSKRRFPVPKNDHKKTAGRRRKGR